MAMSSETISANPHGANVGSVAMGV